MRSHISALEYPEPRFTFPQPLEQEKFQSEAQKYEVALEAQALRQRMMEDQLAAEKQSAEETEALVEASVWWATYINPHFCWNNLANS